MLVRMIEGPKVDASPAIAAILEDRDQG
jgi:hypothetical protein